MAIDYYPIERQAVGNFNNGEILEKKPVGFPQDKGILKPYSNIFIGHMLGQPEKEVQ